MSKMNEIKQILKDHEDLRRYLFIRGFLITNAEDIPTEEYPMYGAWKKTELGDGYALYAHPLTTTATYTENGRCYFFAGHAYNPFTMQHEEEQVLRDLAAVYGTDRYLDALDEVTGVYVYGVLDHGRLEYMVDASGMQSAVYGILNERMYISSHAQLIGDLCGLTMGELPRRYVDYKWYYRVMGPYLPADITVFDEVKRIVPNIAYTYEEGTVKHERFYPRKNVTAATSDEEYQEVIRAGADILRRNMELIARKWPGASISLTGGIDSNTTFAAANGRYDRFKTFSYISAEKEIRDAEAAKTVSERFGVEWTCYNIPETADDIPLYREYIAILEHNNGYMAKRRDNENRKRVYLMQNLEADVEVKSWVSETIRGYWYKHYGRTRMPKLSPKLYRNLYKIFLGDRSLAHVTDRLFKEYLEKYEYYSIPDGFPPADIHFWEVCWGSWGGVSISEMKSYADVVIPYNNRRFLELMFRVPLKKRISDEHHLDMKKELNPELYDMHIRVVNMHETANRARALNVIFTINSWLPF